MQEEIDTYCEKFPADIKEEDWNCSCPRILKRQRESRLIRSEPVCGLMVSEDGTVSEEADRTAQH